MSEAFLKVVNMSIAASWLVLVVFALRLLLKKAPKWMNVLLWGLVAVRLLCPFSIESAMSLIPSAEVFSPTVLIETPEIHTGIPAINNAINPVIQDAVITLAPEKSMNTMKFLIQLFSRVWAVGVALLLAYSAVSVWRLRRRMRTAVILRNNIFRSEFADSPFVLGILKPRIYLPYGMDDTSMTHVIAHEQAHIRRRDHWWKPLGFLLLTIHWFNPLMWVAYILLCRDIELACDERVIRELGNDQRADYSQALVACSVSRLRVAACPLAFGEVGVKERVKNVMNYKEPAFWVIMTAVVACMVAAVCFLTNPVEEAKGFEQLLGSDQIVGSISVSPDLEQIRTQNGDIVLIQNDGGYWFFEEDQDVTVRIAFSNDGSDHSMKSVGYIYCGDGTEGLYANEVLRNQAVPMVDGFFEAPERGNYLFYFRNYSSSWIELESFEVLFSTCLQAEVLEIHNGYFLVAPVEGSRELSSADRIEVPMKNMAPSPEPEVGDMLEIVYSGELMETYPARIGEVYSIRVIMDASEQPAYEPKGVSGSNVKELNRLPDDVQWQSGFGFSELAPGEEILSDQEIVIEEDGASMLLTISWARATLYLEYGIRRDDGTAFFQEKRGGYGHLEIEDIPAGAYRLYVRNSDAYAGIPAYENPAAFQDVSFTATGAINYALN